jgi:hypothetical protein
MKIIKQSTGAAPTALDRADLVAVGGGIWGGPDGTWTCTPGVFDPQRTRRVAQAKRETT